ncbi:DUF2285 domain-containing protein [Oceaniovalibus sp. ACAM 378]|uniref:DUF2285 domain-containing protein n=1 Tax=Oceaniovalibus sp. ACAM 378 TaxID=2599923 RepID=UPI0021065C2F|nr:DUF2285 domain-containing protein [Oceaniovalibus sp. ACAM 378]
MCASLGGCDFPIDPLHDALRAAVYWQPEVDPGTVILTANTPISGQKPVSLPEIDKNHTRHDPNGLSLRIDDNGEKIRLLLIDGAQPGMPLAALIPIDDSCIDRMEALKRLSLLLRDRRLTADTRLTTQRRRRLRRMLQAIDGHQTGATYREIANVIFGTSRVSTEPWKTSALRDATIALVTDGRTLIDGGYRTLLRHRRRS